MPADPFRSRHRVIGGDAKRRKRNSLIEQLYVSWPLAADPVAGCVSFL